MRKALVLAILATLLLSLAAAQTATPSAYTTLKANAEREYAEKSFRRARELYEQAAKLDLPADERRWVTFRIADTTLRERGDDREAIETARRALRELIEKTAHDEVWADANESLGDYENNQQHYLAALDFWAGSSDLARARRRYLDIVWKMARDNEPWNVPRNVLVNATQIAETPEERARARYLLARQYMNDGTSASLERAVELFEEIIAGGRKSEFYDDALFNAAAALSRGGADADYKKALAYYRRIVEEFERGQTPFHDQARQAIREIANPSVGVQVAGTFLPDSEQEVYLTWRNVKQVELTLYGLDLTKEARLDRKEHWTSSVAVEGRPVVRRWTYDTNDTGAHQPGRDEMRLEPRLPQGAYILVARAEGQSARQLLLVTDAHILVHSGGTRMDIYVSDVITGEPIANARVHVWQQVAHDKHVEREAQTDANGLARITTDGAQGATLITAVAGARQAYHQTYTHWYGRQLADAQWRIYAFTDRPAYRPGETVQWKILARMRRGEEWVTPDGAALEYTIVNPRGEKVTSGSAKLSAFGSFWAELALSESMPLGMYTVNFTTAKNEHRGSAELFRLEEYKLPEFLVRVETPEGKQYRLGDTIEATIDASYYFGGPVANATVEAVVYQQPFYRYWYPHRHYHWLYDPAPDYGSGTIIKRETLTTDAAGRAILRIDTPRDGTDMTYRIEARVVDASRREVRGEGNVRVMRQRYSVMARPEHFVHRPGESVSVDFRAVDANDKPVQVTGTVKVVRRVVRGGPVPPPVPMPRGRRGGGVVPPPYRYDEEEVLTTTLTTNAEGEATLTFTPKTTGYYVVRWTSTDGPRARDVITAETAVWVTDRNTTDIGYRALSGLDLIIDKETLRQGETASVMIVTPDSGRWVLFTSAGDDILDTQVVRMDGTVRLVQIPVDKKHIPNFFITASTVFDRALSTDTERIVVPPVEQFLTVDVKPDREQYEPRQEGTVTVTTRDANGRPVSAEVALAVSDEAVTAIQQDTAGDPRQFFYGDVRHNPVQVSAGLQTQQYVKLEEKPPVDKEQDGLAFESYEEMKMKSEAVGGVVGARMRDSAANAAPPPPPSPVPPPVLQSARAEAITVTAEASAVGAGTAGGIDVQVRTDFRSTAFWKPDLITDANGTATVKVAYPEALTTWRATARAASAGAQFGMASSTARTTMPLLVRLQAPRFFVAGDRVTISAVINNNTDEALTVNAQLEATGLSGGQATVPVQVAPHAEARADWTVTADQPGPAKLRVTARNAKYGDAMERAFVVYEHGIDKLIARSGKLRGDEALVRLDLPRERRATDLTVQIAPSLATTMLDALPYLIDFPYGCTEQTMSRFLPAAIVARTIEKLGLGRARVAGKDLDAVTKAGIARLFDMQHENGAWGWWKEGSDDPFMTAYVVWGFSIARDGGIPFDHARIDRAARWLDQHLVQRAGENDRAWLLHALAAWDKTPSANATRAFDEVYKNRERLTSYSRALLALTAHRYGNAERAQVLIRNLEDGVIVDKAPDQSVLLKGETTAETMQTAHWGKTGFWWRWYESPVETTAFALQALVTIDPQNKLVEPAMNWLVRNRRGTRWSNTRDTAIALLALNDYLQRSGELAGDVSYELSVNGKVIATKSVTAAEVLGAPTRFSIDPALLGDTMQEIRIRRTAGKSPLYFAAEARFVSLEEPVKAAGNELFVRREYFRLAPRPTLLTGVQYDRVPLLDRGTIASGERIEVVVTIETKNDYSYLLFEDLKPGGFEAVELQSGQPLYATAKDGRTAWVYQELRDRKVAMFVDHMPQGIWEIRYTLRAEVPGSFHALPLLGHAFYAPDVRANGDEVRIEVR